MTEDEAWFATDRKVSASAEDIDRELHDAWLDLSSVTHLDDAMTIKGYRERPVSGRRFRVGRFPVVLSFKGVDRIELHDPDGLGGIGVCDVTTASGSMTLTSCSLGHLSIIGERLAATLNLSSTPSVERRLLSRRWKPTARG